MSSELLDDFSPIFVGDNADPLEIHFIDKKQNAYPIQGYLALSLQLVNRLTPTTTITGTGTWTAIDVNNGIVDYAYSTGDVARAGNWDIVVGVQLASGKWKHFIPKVLEILPLT